MDTFASAFPGLKLAATEETEEDNPEEHFYLWDINLPLFEVYQITKNYLSEYYGLDTLVIVKLIEAKNLNMVETLEKLPYIHAGYLSIVVPSTSESSNENGREQNFD